MTNSIRQQLLDRLEKVDRPGTFCTSGQLPPTLPGLEVAGMEPVALPLATRQAAALKKLARQAPYGKGTRTLVDVNVRRVWEIDAGQVVLANPAWQDVLKQAVDAVRSEMGLEKQKLQAHLYKLLLYEPGSFFRAHRDGEKLDRMVASLVIVLPSAHEGGELVVRHEGRDAVVDFGPKSQFQTQFAAFYADCEHEIKPVRTGFRLTLVYNLTLEKSKNALTAPTSGEHIAAVSDLLRPWSSESQRTAANSPPRLAVLLGHQYTQSGLTRDALKGIDRARADVLFAAAAEAGCDASLALVTYWETGSAEPSGGYGFDDYGDEGGEHEMGEVEDSSLAAEHFTDAAGNPLAFGHIPLDEDDIVSGQPLGQGKPDREDFEGYTGNAGMTLERWYHRAAVLLWPAETRFDVLCEAGVETAVGGLEQMIREWKQAPKSEKEILRQPCLEFAKRILANWPERKFASGYYSAHRFGDAGKEDLDEKDESDEFDEDEDELVEDADEEGSSEELEDDAEDEEAGPPDSAASRVPGRSLLSLLQELGDVPLISAWIRGVLARDASLDPDTVLGDVCEQYGWKTFEDELQELFDNTSNETLERHTRFLAEWCMRKDKDADRRRLCSHLAEQLMASVERWDPTPASRDWQARVANLRDLLPPLTQAFLVLQDGQLLDRLVTYVLDRPKAFDLTTIQVPALLDLQPWLKRKPKSSSPPLLRWLTAIAAELDTRVSHPPQKPQDWRRESATNCGCADCKELSRFLQDRKTQTLRFPLAEQRRRHLHQVIDSQKLDTTHVTERRGRPYTLVCTKTEASYERAVGAHQVDVDQRAQVRKLPEWLEGR